MSDAREARILEIESELRKRWGDDAADIDNYEEFSSYHPEEPLIVLRAERAKLLDQRANDDWVLTYAAVARQQAPKARQLDETKTEWRDLWTRGVPGLLGGVMALVGGVFTAIGIS